MIIRCISEEKISEVYNSKTVQNNLRWGLTEDLDYVVASIEVNINADSYNKIRYWIMNDQNILTPYDAYNFEVVENTLSSNWVIDVNERGLEIADKKWIDPVYFDKYFEDIKIENEYNEIIKNISKEATNNAKSKGITVNNNS